MRKTLYLSLACIISLLLVGSGLNSQTLKDWEWKKYRIKFKLPSSWIVTKNNDKTFIAKGAGVVMKIGTYKSSNATAKSVANRAFSSYGILQDKKIINQKQMKPRGGLMKYMIVGTAIYRNKNIEKKVYYGIIGMINPENVDRIYVRLWWFAGRKNTGKNSRLTALVANSFLVK